MNPLPPNADELVSAYLDGEAAPHEIAVVESSPELMARVESLRALTSHLGAPVTPPAAQKEAHLAAALGAFDALFAGDEQSTTDAPAPVLASVPDAAPSSAEPVSPPVQPGVTSLGEARERRRPRRFNTGVIAAAAAAVLLFVGLAALSFRGSETNDVATASRADTAVEASDAGSDAADDGDSMDEAEAAMDEDTAMAQSAEAGTDALSEAPPAPTSPPPAAAAEVDADQDDAVEESMDEEEAMDDEEDAMADSDTSGAADAVDDALQVPEAAKFFVGEFDNQRALQLEIDTLPRGELEQRAVDLGDGLFPSCQSDIAELAAVPAATLAGEAVIAGELVELHIVSEADAGSTAYIVSTADCSVLTTITIDGN